MQVHRDTHMIKQISLGIPLMPVGKIALFETSLVYELINRNRDLRGGKTNYEERATD